MLAIPGQERTRVIRTRDRSVRLESVAWDETPNEAIVDLAVLRQDETQLVADHRRANGTTRRRHFFEDSPLTRIDPINMAPLPRAAPYMFTLMNECLRGRRPRRQPDGLRAF